MSADVLCPHGYKANVVGLLAARRLCLPVIAVSRGWTGETWKVRLYERLDRACLRRMDRVVCVSEGQAIKVRRAGVKPERVVVIRNAIRPERFAMPDPSARAELLGLFRKPPDRIVGAAGRLSPEKGFEVLVEAAAITTGSHPGIGFIHFGDGPLRERLQRRIDELGLGHRFLLAGFRNDLDRLIPAWDLAVIPSYTEGLPNIALEAFAAAVPVVGTAVGGVPEVIKHGQSGYLVSPGDPQALRGGFGTPWSPRSTAGPSGRPAGNTSGKTSGSRLRSGSTCACSMICGSRGNARSGGPEPCVDLPDSGTRHTL